MPLSYKFIGIGDLVSDYYFKDGDFLGAAGGGSVWNILSIISQQGYECHAIGSRGIDQAGLLAENDLKKFGVDTSRVKKVKSVSTKRIFVMIPNKYNDKIREVKATYKCPKCGKNYWHSRSFLPKGLHVPTDDKRIIFIIDNLKKENFTFLAGVEEDKLVYMNLGHKFNLRYLKREVLLNYLSNVDILQINKEVINFILHMTKMEVYDFIRILNLRVVIVTDSKKETGFHWIDNNRQLQTLFLKPISVEETDSSGAGDYFGAMFLHKYIKNSEVFNSDFVREIFPEIVYEVGGLVKKIGARGILNGEFTNELPCDCMTDISKTYGNKYKGKYAKSKFQYNYDNLQRKLQMLDYDVNLSPYQNLFLTGGTYLTVGTGASYVPALYFSEVINENIKNSVAISVKPRDAFYLDLSKFSHIILFSYSGKSNDIVKVVEQRNIVSINTKVVIITFQDKKYITKALSLIADDIIISYKIDDSARERGFLSFFGVFAPALQFASFLYNELDVALWVQNRFLYWDNFYMLSLDEESRLWKNISIFAGDVTNIFANAIESIFTESGLCNTKIHEKKDFSHGRFVLLENYKPDIILFPCRVNLSKYEKKLLLYLQKQGHHVLKIESAQDKNMRLDFLIAGYALMNRLAIINDIDLSNPVYDKAALQLYRFNSDFC